MDQREKIEIPQKKITEFCKRNHICKLSLFGSVLQENFRPDSDIDMLVEFDPDHIPGLIRLAGMEIELTDILGRKVDLRTPQDLSRYLGIFDYPPEKIKQDFKLAFLQLLSVAAI